MYRTNNSGPRTLPYYTAATECGVDDHGHTHSRGNVVLLLVMSAVTGLK